MTFLDVNVSNLPESLPHPEDISQPTEHRRDRMQDRFHLDISSEKIQETLDLTRVIVLRNRREDFVQCIFRHYAEGFARLLTCW